MSALVRRVAGELLFAARVLARIPRECGTRVQWFLRFCALALSAGAVATALVYAAVYFSHHDHGTRIARASLLAGNISGVIVFVPLTLVFTVFASMTWRGMWRVARESFSQGHEVVDEVVKDGCDCGYPDCEECAPRRRKAVHHILSHQEAASGVAAAEVCCVCLEPAEGPVGVGIYFPAAGDVRLTIRPAPLYNCVACSKIMHTECIINVLISGSARCPMCRCHIK